MGAGLVAVPACQLFRPQCKAVCLQWFCQGGADGTIAEIPSATLPSVHRGLAPTHFGPRHDQHDQQTA